MLVEKKTLAGKIGVFKMITGEEVIARVVDEVPVTGGVMIKNPLAMVMVPDNNNTQGMVAFAPWMLGANDDVAIELKGTAILAAVEARTDAAAQYSQAVGEDVQATPKIAPQNLSGQRGGRGR